MRSKAFVVSNQHTQAHSAGPAHATRRDATRNTLIYARWHRSSEGDLNTWEPVDWMY